MVKVAPLSKINEKTGLGLKLASSNSKRNNCESPSFHTKLTTSNSVSPFTFKLCSNRIELPCFFLSCKIKILVIHYFNTFACFELLVYFSLITSWLFATTLRGPFAIPPVALVLRRCLNPKGGGLKVCMAFICSCDELCA